MKIVRLFSTGKPLFSFEFFPPKTDEGTTQLEATIADLAALHPAYVSVTYGAGGSTRERTLELVARVQNKTGLVAMAHLTCVGAARAELGQVVDRLRAIGIENIIALRGDPPAGKTRFSPVPDGMAHASDLVTFIRERHGDAFCLAGAAYPEGHVECRDLELDLLHLRKKVEAGLDFLITQLFFDNRHYFDFVARARAAGITVPIVPGIMPILNAAQIERFTRMCGATIPAPLQAELTRLRGDPVATEALGIEHALEQCRALLAAGAPGIHFYTLNRSRATRSILERLRSWRPPVLP